MYAGGEVECVVGGSVSREWEQGQVTIVNCMCIRGCMVCVCYLQVADVCYHVCEERVACNVEWDTQSLCVCVCVCIRHFGGH